MQVAVCWLPDQGQGAQQIARCHNFTMLSCIMGQYQHLRWGMCRARLANHELRVYACKLMQFAAHTCRNARSLCWVPTVFGCVLLTDAVGLISVKKHLSRQDYLIHLSSKQHTHMAVECGGGPTR